MKRSRIMHTTNSSDSKDDLVAMFDMHQLELSHANDRREYSGTQERESPVKIPEINSNPYALSDSNGSALLSMYDQPRVNHDIVHKCVKHGDLKDLKKLASEPTVNGKNMYMLAREVDADGFTALHYAAAMNKGEILTFLLDRNAKWVDIDLENREGDTLLQVAIR